MKVLCFHQTGTPDVLRIEDWPKPAPGPGQLLVQVQVAGIAYGDVMRRAGHYSPVPITLPAIPGLTVAGTVAEVGEGVSKKWIGKRVYGMVWTGGCAEFAAGSEDDFVEMPDSVSAVDAVAVMTDGIIGYLALRYTGRLQPGQSVFVPAAAGGLGSVMVQLARAYGATTVIGGASTEAKRQLVLDIGADAVVDYTKESWAAQVIAANGGQGVDLALEMSGGAIFHETILAVRPRGTILNYGNASETATVIDPNVLLERNLTLAGFMYFGPWDEEKRAARRDIMDRLADGSLKAVSATTYALEDGAKAHAAIENRSSSGRQVLLVST